MYNEVIYLLTTKYTTNDVGDSIEVPETSMRLARLKSIGQAEFYQAQAQGLKPEIKFVLADYLDYNNQEEVIYNNHFSTDSITLVLNAISGYDNNQLSKVGECKVALKDFSEPMY